MGQAGQASASQSAALRQAQLPQVWGGCQEGFKARVQQGVGTT